MATQALQRPQEFKDEGVHPLVEASGLVEAAEVEEEAQNAPAMEMVTYTLVPIRRDALLARIARPILRLDDWFSGPPMTKRDRLNLSLEYPENSRRIVPIA